MVDLTKIIVAIITLAISCITYFLVPYIKEKKGNAAMEKITLWVKIAVQAAEMIYEGNDRGEEKKAYVEKFLNSKGFKLDFEEIENLIEAAVLELKQS